MSGVAGQVAVPPRARRAMRARRYATPMLIGGVAIIGLMTVLAFVVPALSPYDPREANPGDALLPPGGSHLFGTDENGFDIFTRVFYAPRIDFSVAAAGVALGVLVGVPIGVAAGFTRGILGEIAMRLTDLLQAFPVIVIALTLVTVAGGGVVNVVVAIAAITAPLFIRLVRVEVLSVREQRYVEAAVALGNPPGRLLRRHVLPNALGGAIVQIGVSLGYATVTLSALAFLGIGVQPPTPEWGAMIRVGVDNITTGQWWTIVFPGLALAIAVVGFNLISDGVGAVRRLNR